MIVYPEQVLLHMRMQAGLDISDCKLDSDLELCVVFGAGILKEIPSY